jgi:glycosyltransferase involved in cell wall biosynthesis
VGAKWRIISNADAQYRHRVGTEKLKRAAFISAMPAPEKEASRKFSLLLIMNGSLAVKGQTVGGGDMVLFKFLRLSNIRPDVLIPKSAAEFAENPSRIFLTRANEKRLTTVGIVSIFLARIFQGIVFGLRNKQKYDVALAASPFAVDVIPLSFWKARHKGLVIYHVLPKRKAVSIATFFRFGIAALEQKITMGLIRRTCDFIVAGNEFTKQQLGAIMPGKPMFILPAGFDAAFIDKFAAEKKDPNLACFVGRLVSQKGILDLLKVMDELRRTHPDFKLVIAGSGPERDFFVSEMQRLKLTNIELAGFVSEEQKISLLKRSQYFFFPSYEEGWGIALAEALYCECRCLCYELPHYRSIFGDFPVYAKLGDPNDFVRAFRQSGPASPEQKNLVRQYDDPLAVQHLVEHLQTITASER